MDYCFELTAMPIPQLLPQVSRALEKRTELVSRERMPGLWERADTLNGKERPTQQRTTLQKRIRSAVYLAAGIFLLVPGLAAPRNPLLLIAGGLCIVIGLFGLWRIRPGRKSRFDKSAERLLAGKDAIVPGEFQVTFSPTEMRITRKDDAETVPYARFAYVIETEDLLLPIFDDRVLLLQKRDLISGEIDALRGFLAAQTKIIPVE